MKPNKNLHKIPNFNKDCPVRMNAATIFREDALFQKEQHKQAQLLKEFEFGLRDCTEFDEWKEKELLNEEMKNIQIIEDRKLEMQQCSILAKKAVEATINEKHNIAQQMNFESELKMKEKKENDRILLNQKNEIAQKIKSEHQNTMIAVQKHEAQNK
eukprot:16701_1